MSLTAWARQKQPIDLTADLVLALALFALAIPLLLSLDSKNTPTPSAGDPQTAKPVKVLRQAIIGQESGGQCGITNHDGSDAAGLAQVMPENVTAWSREALGRAVSVDEFLQDCRIQLRVIDHKLGQYWQQEAQDGRDEAAIVRRIASRWYAGQANLFDSNAPQFWNGRQYPSIHAYTLAVLSRYQSQRPP
jgi:hypothetical protein